ncbi:6907_t:CDS:1, partial [Dentiscutata heterogama]
YDNNDEQSSEASSNSSLLPLSNSSALSEQEHDELFDTSNLYD